MKKVLAVLLAVLMTFSVLTVCAAAEDETGTGTVYTYTSTGIPRIKAADTNGRKVTILQAGDIIRFSELTAATKHIEIRYYPDAAAIKNSNIKNVDWKDNMVPKYNLDSSKWVLGKDQTVEDLMAKSPKYYKSFYSYADFVKGDVPEIQITGLNAEEIFTRDSANVDRGEAAIDFALEGAKFVGWALFDYNWTPGRTATNTIDVYALWERGAAPETPTEPEKPGTPDTPDESQNPIQRAFAKVMYYISEGARYIGMVPPALSTLIPNYLNGLIRNWLYGLFGIEA